MGKMIKQESKIIGTPRVFISYSWSNQQHEEWVLELAQRLISDGIDVVLDKWNLKEGHDLNVFMEKHVNSKEINKVLMILDKKYVEKANSRSGGEGTETQIISPEIYGNTEQERFIPIVTELDENENPYLPTYLKTRKYMDFSNYENFEKSYEHLIRNI